MAVESGNALKERNKAIAADASTFPMKSFWSDNIAGPNCAGRELYGKLYRAFA